MRRRSWLGAVGAALLVSAIGFCNLGCVGEIMSGVEFNKSFRLLSGNCEAHGRFRSRLGDPEYEAAQKKRAAEGVFADADAEEAPAPDSSARFPA